jgi:hypothetical protein
MAQAIKKTLGRGLSALLKDPKIYQIRRRQKC